MSIQTPFFIYTIAAILYTEYIKVNYNKNPGGTAGICFY